MASLRLTTITDINRWDEKAGLRAAWRTRQLDALTPLLLDYARLSTLAFFQLKTTKDELLAQLDRTMIDPSALNTLHETLSAVRYR